MTFVSYAQNLEDLVLWRALKDIDAGFYIDVGAADPTVHSVTHAFYERGWSGINIEPTAAFFERLSAERPRDINLNALAGEAPGVVTLFEFESLGLSTMDEPVARRHIEAGIAHRTVAMPVLTLASVCESRGAKPIHFLKIDVEGAERAVLLGMDFTQYRPWVVVVEATEPMSPVSTRARWEDVIVNAGYVFAHFDGLNCYYVAPDHQDLKDILSVPPSIFDEYIRVEEEVFRRQAEEWRLRLVQLGEEAEGWRQDLLNRQADIENLHAHLASVQAHQAALQGACDQALAERDEALRQSAQLTGDLARQADDLARQAEALRHRDEALAHRAAEIERLAGELARRAEEIARLGAHIAEIERLLAATWASFSWRVTIPLRDISRRFPGVARTVRDTLARHPRVAQLVRRVLRGARRAVSGQPMPVPALSEPPPAVTQPAVITPQAAVSAPAALPANPKSWMFLGDTIEWLQTHQQLSGVGKVTTELFLASVAGPSRARLLPCAPAPNPSGMASISLADTAAYLAHRSGAHPGTSIGLWLVRGDVPPAVAFAPVAGDHVLFTGVVWTDHYVRLFLDLVQQGIRFSVFVYDIIPILNPEFVDAAFLPGFRRWLQTVLTRADCVFVSSPGVRDQILRWAALSDIVVSARLVPVAFGMAVPTLQDDSDRGINLPGVRAGNFVLSVGTIDRRKNQSLLCRVWTRLLDDLGQAAVPQLVLVGRDDLDLSNHGPARAAIENRDIVVLQGVSDADLARLYAACQFTAFPSLSEGYGLPVAESLAFGKLCVASDLPVIREHAGELPWYFPPNDEAAAYAALKAAITDLPARQAAEARIAADFRSSSWVETIESIASSIDAALRQPPAPMPPQPNRLVVPGVGVPATLPALDKARAWCTEDDPDVSILIINWNAYRLTRACVQHIWANTTDIRYEIIIADNGSGAEDLAALSSLGRGVRLLPLGVNRYFGEACNIAAEAARGRILCLLNNDCFGQPGWLVALVGALQSDPSVGAAWPLFLFPDQTVQEAGGSINEGGYPVRFGRGEKLQPGAAPDYMTARDVDYISAAALVMRRDTYLRAGGFDLSYEPAYYEDADLCFKLRALGLTVRFCPEARAVHIEGAAANEDPAATARRKALGDLNRGKFVSRWGRYLQSRGGTDLAAIAGEIFIDPSTDPGESRRRTAALYTPYAITPGGGERFLLTIASLLAEDHDVVVVTPQPYSRLRLLNIGHEFGIDLSRCQPMTEAAFLAAAPPDLMVTVGNHIVPPIQPRTRNSFYICQFPFPMPAGMETRTLDWEFGYRRVIVYSEYAKAHVLAALSAYRMPRWPVEVAYPAVPQVAGRAAAKKQIVLTVGRFFAGGHNKRHDLMIEAFLRLQQSFDGPLEMHLAGSSMPEPMHMNYLNELMRMAEGKAITFHVNASQETLTELYRDAAVYWHATGLGADLAREPFLAEHFGISLVEAMSAECVPLAFNAGGPREIIDHGVNGYLYGSIEELVALTQDVLRPGNKSARKAMGQAAGQRARGFAPDVFARRVSAILREP